jgi:hypothetical protein
MSSSSLPSSAPFSPASPSPPAPKTWLQRNWKWFVPALALAGLLAMATFVIGIFLLVRVTMTSSYPYKFAIQRAEHSPQVAAEIGTPIHVGWLILGRFNYQGSEGDADLDVPIYGPRGTGHLFIVAKKHAGRWTFQTLEVDVMGDPVAIPLVQPGNEEVPEGPGQVI